VRDHIVEFAGDPGSLQFDGAPGGRLVLGKAKNLLWVEGPGVADTLAGLAGKTCGSTPTGNCLISPSLGPVVYAVHHPYGSDINNPNSPPADSATWWKEFGWVVNHPASTGVAPVVIGEWTNFDAYNPPNHPVTNKTPPCWTDAPQQVPNFLTYLATIGVGLNAYQLDSPTNGFLLKVSQSWTDTTNYTDAAWNPNYCKDTTAPLLAAGADILGFFQRQN
jgi:hypothetical protein